MDPAEFIVCSSVGKSIRPNRVYTRGVQYVMKIHLQLNPQTRCDFMPYIYAKRKIKASPL